MKYLLSLSVLFSVFALSCSNEKKTEVIDPEIKKEIVSLETDSLNIEQAKKEIEESSMKLTELLNDL